MHNFCNCMNKLDAYLSSHFVPAPVKVRVYKFPGSGNRWICIRCIILSFIGCCSARAGNEGKVHCSKDVSSESLVGPTCNQKVHHAVAVKQSCQGELKSKWMGRKSKQIRGRLSRSNKKGRKQCMK